MTEIDPASDWCQRWLPGGGQRWRHKSEGGFDPRDDYEVAPLARDTEPKRFLAAHHYLIRYPAALLRLGLYHGHSLVGVAVFSMPMNNAVLTRVFPDLVPGHESMELGRFCVLDPEPGNVESWFLGQCFRYLATQGVRGVVSFSDPTPRESHNGKTVFAGHVGTIYQATNFLSAGRTDKRRNVVLPDGSVFTQREEQKLISGDQGHAYVLRRLLSNGAPSMLYAERGREYLHRAYAHIGVRIQVELGKHRYVQTVGKHRDRVRIAVETYDEYPKRVDAATYAA